MKIRNRFEAWRYLVLLARLRCIHKSSESCLASAILLNPPILGDFELDFPPELGGLRGANAGF